MSVSDDDPRASEGLRERKRRQTRERIISAAIALFLKGGYDTTTIDDIVAEADISKRSFFDYFPSKEDVIYAWQDDFGLAFAAAVDARPFGEPLPLVVQEALNITISPNVGPQAKSIAKLVRQTPTLRQRDQLKYAELEATLAEALCRRCKNEGELIRANLLAMIVVGTIRVGKEDWESKPRFEKLEEFIGQYFELMRTILASL